MKLNLAPPYTYFRKDGFSINEGEFPNIHISWRRWAGTTYRRFYFYLAMSRLLKLRLSFPLGFTNG